MNQMGLHYSTLRKKSATALQFYVEIGSSIQPITEFQMFGANRFRRLPWLIIGTTLREDRKTISVKEWDFLDL